MDDSAVNVNLTVDDFDSLLTYADQSQWTTPDPFGPDYHPESSPYVMGTYHRTDVVDAEVSFNYTGPSIWIYGQRGPDFGSFEIRIDGDAVYSLSSAYSETNDTTTSLLFSAVNMSYAEHSLVMRNRGMQGNDNGGNAFLFDYLQTTVQLAPAGATVVNQTLEESDESLQYSGQWDTNQSGNFSGGGSTYTNTDSSVSLSFQGSAIYVFGDKKNDHGLYNVVLDNGTAQTYNGVSGCGGAFAPTCEQQQPTIKYFASNLDGNEHTLTITNVPGVNNSFFDLDSIVVTVPSQYAPRDLNSSSSDSSSSGGNAAQGEDGDNGALSSYVALQNLLLLLLFITIMLLRPRL